MVFEDINAINVIENSAQKEDQKTYKKSSSKSTFIKDKY